MNRHGCGADTNLRRPHQACDNERGYERERGGYRRLGARPEHVGRVAAVHAARRRGRESNSTSGGSHIMRLWYRSWGMESPPVTAALTNSASTVAAAKPRTAERLHR